jgi:hypothetical protein
MRHRISATEKEGQLQRLQPIQLTEINTSKMSALQTFMLTVDRDKQAAIAIAEQTAQGNQSIPFMVLGTCGG